MQSPYSDFDILQLPNYAASANLNDELILIDNLSDVNDEMDTKFLGYPVKLSFSITILCLSGSISFKINLKEYNMIASDMLIVQRGDFGEFLSMTNDCKMIVIAYTEEYFRHTQYSGSAVSLQRLFYEFPLCHLNQKAIDECVSIYHLMKSKISETDNPYRKGALMGYIQVLLYDAYSYFETILQQGNSVKKTSRKDEIFEKFILAVQKDYRKHRDITHYADILCISSKYLSQIVQQVTGKLAGEWIADYVILEAKALLKNKRFTIQQISDYLNFTNQSFFGRYFKDKVGCSPTAYQKRD